MKSDNSKSTNRSDRPLANSELPDDAPTANLETTLLLFVVVCQAVTVWITWPLWQVRQQPPNLPCVSGLPNVPFGWLMIASLVPVPIRPKIGMAIHAVVLASACFFDQFRLEPQFIGLAVLMVGCLSPVGTRLCRWQLAAMWFWAGLHKLLSADWIGHTTWTLIRQSGLNPEGIHEPLAVGIALGEISLGLLAIFLPVWAARFCIPLHIGIVIYMSPLMAGINESVIPWNLATAVIGYWVLMRVDRPSRLSFRQLPLWEPLAYGLMFVVPVGFYTGWVDRCFAHVLYSDNLPRAMITRDSGTEKVTGWGELAVPFPSERRLYRQYFSLTCDVGDKLHVYEPRPHLEDQFYLLGDDGPRQIDADKFFRVEENEVAGVALDSKRSVFALSRKGVTMLRESKKSPVYAVAFTPENFDRRLLRHVVRLPNLQQIQFEGTSIEDRDLEVLTRLRLLNGLGLNQTSVTDEGLKKLDDLPYLQYVETDGTSIRDVRGTSASDIER